MSKGSRQKKVKELSEWLVTPPECSVCSQGEEYTDLIELALMTIAEGKSKRCPTTVYRWLKERGLQGSLYQFREHCRHCIGGLYGRAKQ